MTLRESISTHIHHLATGIGPRPFGSPDNQAAADAIAREMSRLGYEVERQPFDCPAWACQKAEFWLDGHNLPVLANPFSPPCEVSGELVLASTLAELEQAEITGKIALLYGDLTRQPLACKSWFLKEERDTRIIELLEQKQPLAVLTVQAEPGSVTRLIEDQEFLLPSATLPQAAACQALLRRDAPARLVLETTTHPSTTANVIGRRAGSRPETLVVCAHYDTKVDTPGALDNAAGIAAMLGLAEVFAREPLACGLELIAFANEEYLPMGDEPYLRGVGEDHLNQILLAVNFDGLGFLLEPTTLAIFTASPELTRRVESLKAGFPAIQWVEPWPESNHSTFAWRGVPSLALSSRSLAGLNHQPGDSEQWVDLTRVEEGARLVEQVFRAIQAEPMDALRPASTEKMG